MKIEQKALDDHQIHLSVEIEDESLKSARQRAARKIAKRIKVPGFRPGKAPYNVIEKQVGPEAIEDEALDIVLEDVYPQVIEETGIKPWGPGTLEKVHEDKQPRVFEFRVPLSPEVELGDYESIRIKFEPKEVTEEDIQGVLDNLREQQAMLEPVERAAEEGDMVYVQMSAERDKPDEDGNTILLPGRRYPVVVEKADVDDKDEWPFPGFSRKLISLKPGDEKEFKHKFAKESEFEDLRGESATFKIEVEEIKDRILPELGDEFAKSLGDYENVNALRDEVKESLETNYKQQSEDEYDNQIVEEIIEKSTIKYPPQMLEHEIEHYIEDLEPRLAQQGMDMDTYLKSRQMEMSQLEDEVRPAVEERLKKSLVLMEVSEKEDIKIAEDEMQNLVQDRIQRLTQLMSEEQAAKALSGDALQGLVSRTMTEEIIGRTLNVLRSIAQGNGRPAAEPETDEDTAEETTEEQASEVETNDE